MKNKLLLSALLTTVLTSSAHAADFYVGLGGNVNSLQDAQWKSNGAKVGTVHYDSGFGVGLTAGANVTNNVRAELEYGYRHQQDVYANTAGGDILIDKPANSHALMANMYYDFKTPNSKFSPYIGAGIGGARLTDSGSSDNKFAYQGMLGVNYDFTDSATGYMGYKYFATLNPEYSISELEYKTHNLEAGFRFKLGQTEKSSNYSYSTGNYVPPVQQSYYQPNYQPEPVQQPAQYNYAPNTYAQPVAQTQPLYYAAPQVQPTAPANLPPLATSQNYQTLNGLAQQQAQYADPAQQQQYQYQQPVQQQYAPEIAPYVAPAR